MKNYENITWEFPLLINALDILKAECQWDDDFLSWNIDIDRTSLYRLRREKSCSFKTLMKILKLLNEYNVKPSKFNFKGRILDICNINFDNITTKQRSYPRK